MDPKTNQVHIGDHFCLSLTRQGHLQTADAELLKYDSTTGETDCVYLVHVNNLNEIFQINNKSIVKKPPKIYGTKKSTNKLLKLYVPWQLENKTTKRCSNQRRRKIFRRARQILKKGLFDLKRNFQ